MNRLGFPITLGCLIAFAQLVGLGIAADKAANDGAITFTAQRPFLQLPTGFALGECSAVTVNQKGEIYLFHRGPRPILCFDSSGKLLRAWGDDLIKSAHGLRLDRDENVWVTDVAGHRVYKFDPTGQQLLVLGTGEAGAGNNQFNKPTDIAFGLNDEVYISDGYGNCRVLKFNQKGTLQSTWGTAGTKPGQFNLPHSIVVDRQGRVLVGDRENNRIQVFDADGKWLATWKGFAPYGMAFDTDGVLFVADGRAAQIVQLDDRGKVKRRWGREGTEPGQFQMPHMLAFDADGNLYVAEVDGKRMQKFARKNRNAAK